MRYDISSLAPSIAANGDILNTCNMPWGYAKKIM